MRRRSVSTVLASGVSALLLGCLAPAAGAASPGHPATYKGTTATGGTVELTVSPDGASVTRFRVTKVRDTCGELSSGTVEVAVPIVGESFSNGSPNAGPVFAGTFRSARRVEGTVSYRTGRVNVRYDGCDPKTVRWTATISSRPRVLVSYRQDGGFGGSGPPLVVSSDRRATVTVGGCAVRFSLKLGAWNRLRAALTSADLHAIAGDYLPPAPVPDGITYVINAGRSTVRIASPPRPEHEDVMRDLEPLLEALNRTVSVGKQRTPPSCNMG